MSPISTNNYSNKKFLKKNPNKINCELPAKHKIADSINNSYSILSMHDNNLDKKIQRFISCNRRLAALPLSLL